MSFLRKWGNSGPAVVNSTAIEPAKSEWHNETLGERYYGMENFGNTCYANSVLQSLYFCKPFRQLIESHRPLHDLTNNPLIHPTASTSTSNLSSGASITSNRPKSSGTGTSIPSSLSQRSNTTSRKNASRPGTSAGRSTLSNAFGHKRTNSGGKGSEAAGPNSIPVVATLVGGASLTPTSSFTGVGTPTVNTNGNLAVPSASTAVESTLLTTLHDLFVTISGQDKTTGTVAPQAFINQLKRDNEFFRSTLHQDAHEFLNYLMNMIAEAVEKEEKDQRKKDGTQEPEVVEEHASKTWVHRLFEGVLTNETRCLTCETVTSRDEAFLDLSIDIEPNSSVTACLRQFSASEMLCQRNKFSCDKCCGLQEAEKRMKIKKLPNVLALHLKRFKYEESLQRHVKLTYRVVFPFELRLFNTADGMSNPDRLYELWAIVVHIGVGPHHGHYITIVKSGARWIVFDDNSVYPIDESELQRYFGDTPGQGSGYVLFYQAVDLDMQDLGLIPRKNTTDSFASSFASPPPIDTLNSSSLLHPTVTSPIVSPVNGNIHSPPASDSTLMPPASAPSHHPSLPTAIPPLPLSSLQASPQAEGMAPAPTSNGTKDGNRRESAGMRSSKSHGSMSSILGRSFSLGQKDSKRSISISKADKSSLLPSAFDEAEPPTSGESTLRPVDKVTSPFSDQSPATHSVPSSNSAFDNYTLSPPRALSPATLPRENGGQPHESSPNAHLSFPSYLPPPPTHAARETSPSSDRRGSRSSVDSGSMAATRSFLRKTSRASTLPLSFVPPPGLNGSRNGHGSESGRETNGNDEGYRVGRGGSSGGASFFTSPSSSNAKKEAEKKLKEERKLREKEEKERAKLLKESLKRQKEEAEVERKMEKVRRKMSLKVT